MRLHSEPALFHIVQEKRAVVFKRWAVARSHPLGSRIRAVLLPCQVLRKVFRGKFVDALKRALVRRQLPLFFIAGKFEKSKPYGSAEFLIYQVIRQRAFRNE